MNSIDFCFWLQGHFEIADSNSLSDKQVKIIKDHLHLVFLHEIDPLRESETEVSKIKLDNVHNGGKNNDSLVRC